MLRLALIVAMTVFLGAVSPSRAAEPLPQPNGPVVLTVSGSIERANVGNQARFDMDMLTALGMATVTTRSEVSDNPQVFEGVPLRAVLERVGAKGRAIRASALNDYVAIIPLDDLRFEPILAMRADGRVLTVRDKGPLWVVYPRDSYKVLDDSRYDSRWVWQLNKIHVEGP
jgi:hypothetical protein